MKVGGISSGFVRNLDSLGRVVLPVEWRRTFELNPGAQVELIPQGDGTLMLRRYGPNGTCTFCGQAEGIRMFAGRQVCRTCVDQLATEVSH
jgi:AbrB family transcriptional regulator, transcriptional pleiotropic regulator of transition state genes